MSLFQTYVVGLAEFKQSEARPNPCAARRVGRRAGGETTEPDVGEHRRHSVEDGRGDTRTGRKRSVGFVFSPDSPRNTILVSIC